jgi:hypothetical protein
MIPSEKNDKTQYFNFALRSYFYPIIYMKWLILYIIILAVYFEKHKKQIKTVCENGTERGWYIVTTVVQNI